MKNIYIYNDLGVSHGIFSHTFKMLTKLSPEKQIIHEIDANWVINGKWIDDGAIFVMPGGAALYYAQKLNGAGNQMIKTFVNQGGTYLGICAGAYYASKEVEFNKGSKNEVLSSNELSFFSGKSVGPAISYYEYDSIKGVSAAKVSYRYEHSDYESLMFLYHHGGGYFENANNFTNTDTIAYYETENNKKLPAIIKINCGKGQAILSGVHFEVDPCYLDHVIYENNAEAPDLLEKLHTSNLDRELFINYHLGDLVSIHEKLTIDH